MPPRTKPRFTPTNGVHHAPVLTVAPLPEPPLRLDFGCGGRPREGFIGVDRQSFGGKAEVVCNLVEPVHVPIPAGFEWMADVFERKVVGYKVWPWGPDSVEEGYTSHFIEHLSGVERCHFCNELYRVLKPGAKCMLIAPHWASCRAYGDPTHQWPPVGEFWFYYLSREWRKGNAPHTDDEHWVRGLNCDFEVTWGYNMHPSLTVRNPEFQQDAFQWKKEAIQDVMATLTAKK